MNLALRGPALSGKTTLANYLGKHCGFVVVRYNDILKQKAAQALTRVGRKTTLNDIRHDKETYRSFLQELGSLLHFDEGAFIDEALTKYEGTETSIVFDNVRFLAQWERLKEWRFTLVSLQLPSFAQEERAVSLGASLSHFGAAMRHPAELGFPPQPGEIKVDATLPTKDIVADVLAWQRWQGAA